MDILNKDAYFSRERLQVLKGITEQAMKINEECLKNHRELLESNICKYIKFVCQRQIEYGLKACVVVVEGIPQKKEDVVMSQLQHLRLQINARVLIMMRDGMLDLVFEKPTPTTE